MKQRPLREDIKNALVQAGGANYDLGNIRSGVQAGATGAIKNASKSFFQQKDAETEVKNVVFAKNIRVGKDISACDLGNRSMTASASEARRNTVGYTGAATADAGSADEVSEPQPAEAVLAEAQAVDATQAPAAAVAAAQEVKKDDVEASAGDEEAMSEPRAATPEVVVKPPAVAAAVPAADVSVEAKEE